MPPTNTHTSFWEYVPKRVHDETGYWGPVDASTQFCEPHYATSHYVAEFYDSLSSAIFIGAAVHFYNQHLRTLQKKKTHNKTNDYALVTLACLVLAIIGVGSILFHATMRRTMQFLDEFPMVVFLSILCIHKLYLHPTTRPHASVYSTAVVLLALGIFYVYAVLEQFDIFVHLFSCFVVIEVIMGVLFYNRTHRHPNDRLDAWAALACICLGRTCWELEQHLCATVPLIWPMHIAWHVLACGSAYSWLKFNTLIIKAGNTDTITKQKQ